MGYDNLVGAILIWFLISGLISIVSFIFWILQLIRLFKRKDKTAAISILVVGIILCIIGLILFFVPIPLLWIPTVIALFLGRSSEEEEIKKEEYFWCGICNIKYQRDFLGGETLQEGKICRSCLGKKQRGETINPNQNQPKPIINEPNLFTEPPAGSRAVRDDYRERKYLFRQLRWKQSSKNSYLTSFFINLFVFQWLVPLIVILFLWISLKDNMKVQALNNPGIGLTTEIPFTTVIKDFFKILTSENYVYGGHTILISLAWKIGIVSSFLIPSITWIYSLVRFFGFKGEVEQLETEIEATKR